MEDANNSFFHLVTGIIIFILACTCLMFGLRSVMLGAKMRQERLGDEVVYETVGFVGERIVSGDWICTYLMSEPEYNVRIVMVDSQCELVVGQFVSNSIGTLGIPGDSLFAVTYEYGSQGKIKAVCFTECDENE